MIEEKKALIEKFHEAMGRFRRADTERMAHLQAVCVKGEDFESHLASALKLADVVSQADLEADLIRHEITALDHAVYERSHRLVGDDLEEKRQDSELRLQWHLQRATKAIEGLVQGEAE